MTATIHNLTDYRRRYYGLREESVKFEKILNTPTDLEHLNLRIHEQDIRAQACLRCPDCHSPHVSVSALKQGVPYMKCHNCGSENHEVTQLVIALQDLDHDILVYEP